MIRDRFSWLLLTVVLVGIWAGDLSAENQPKPATESAFALSDATTNLIPEAQGPVIQSLKKAFGDPTHPVIPAGLPLTPNVSNGQVIYEKLCVRCHGTAGNGAGADSKELKPLPRDFRLGQFKWKSTSPQFRPLRHDLRETLRLGIPQTAMPSFADLTESEASSVVEYVRWLSMAGNYDHRLATEFSAEFSMNAVNERLQRGEIRSKIAAEAADALENQLADSAREVLTFINDSWKQSELETSIVRPKTRSAPSTDASVSRGRKVYLSDRTMCFKCHGPEGIGDGLATKDKWPIPGTRGLLNKTPGLHDLWGNLNQPWDLTRERYRGGDSHEDLFRRIYAGIPGTSMPAFGGTALTDAEIWDLVDFVESIQPEKVRGPSSSARKPPPPGEVN